MPHPGRASSFYSLGLIGTSVFGNPGPRPDGRSQARSGGRAVQWAGCVNDRLIVKVISEDKHTYSSTCRHTDDTRMAQMS